MELYSSLIATSSPAIIQSFSTVSQSHHSAYVLLCLTNIPRETTPKLLLPILVRSEEFRNISTPLCGITPKFSNPYKHQKAGNIVFKYDLIYLGYSLEDFIIIIYATIIKMNDLNRYLQVTRAQQRTLGFETTLWSASFNTIWNDFEYPKITVEINTIRFIVDPRMLEL